MKSYPWVIAVAATVAFTGFGCELSSPNSPVSGSPNVHIYEIPPDIYAITVDGNDLVRLTSDRNSYRPQFSPDGTKILFLSYPISRVDTVSLNRMNGDGSGREVLATDVSKGNLFSQSHDGSIICYIGHQCLTVLSLKTRELILRLHWPVFDPEFSFDESRIFFRDYSRIYCGTIDAWDIHACYEGRGIFSCSPIDDRILVNGEGDLFIVSSAGVISSAIAHKLNLNSRPHFSPDGGWAMYESGDSIYKVSVDAGNPIRLANGYSASFSRDGRKVLFVKDPPGGGEYSCMLCIVNADGTGEKVLLQSHKDIKDPCFSTDGGRIVFWQ